MSDYRVHGEHIGDDRHLLQTIHAYQPICKLFIQLRIIVQYLISSNSSGRRRVGTPDAYDAENEEARRKM